MKLRFLQKLLNGVVCSLFISGTAIAAPILDQVNYGPRAGGFLVGVTASGDVHALAQSFTTSMNGLLTSFELDLNTDHPNNAGSMTIYLRESLIGPNLGSFIHVNSSEDGFYAFDASGYGIYAEVDKEFFIVATSDNNSFGTWWGNGNGESTYAGGIAYSGINGNLTARPNMDMLFKSYVDTEIQSVPIPASAVLFLSAIIGLLGLKKSRI